jgi:hypothetical protein
MRPSSSLRHYYSAHKATARLSQFSRVCAKPRIYDVQKFLYVCLCVWCVCVCVCVCVYVHIYYIYIYINIYIYISYIYTYDTYMY